MHPILHRAIQAKRSQLQRTASIGTRQTYTDRLLSAGADYREWTNTVYQELFGATAEDLRQRSTVAGDPAIARNHLNPTQLGLVSGVENRVARSGIPDLEQAHQQAIAQVKREQLLLKLLRGRTSAR